MSDHAHHHPAEAGGGPDVGISPQQPGFWRSTTGLATIAFLAIAAFFLVTEHRAHVIPWLPWLILLACPLLHVFYDAQRQRRIATTGVYSYVRHPQHVGLILVMFGFLLQWPTLLTLAMFPVLVFMYVRLARLEERKAIAEFGADYQRNMQAVPAFIPRLGDFTHGPSQGRPGSTDRMRRWRSGANTRSTSGTSSWPSSA